MTGRAASEAPDRTGRGKVRTVPALLGLFAAPAFAAMALLTLAVGGRTDTCMGHAATPLTGMAPMYLLMCIFHMAPWLRLAGRRGTIRRR